MQTKIVFFDLDGTLVDGYEYIYQHLWEYFGVDREIPRTVLKQYLKGEISYPNWVANDVRLLREAGATKSKILEAISSLRPMTGARDVITELRSKGIKLIIISGGIDLVVEAVYPDFADLFAEIHINRYFFGEDGLIDHAEPTTYDMEHKATGLRHTAKRLGVGLAETVFVGDNVNDVQAALVAGTSIAFNAKSDELVQVATHHVESNDLRDILPLIV